MIAVVHGGSNNTIGVYGGRCSLVVCFASLACMYVLCALCP